MAAMWRVSVCVVTLLVLCGSVFGSAKKEDDRGRYVNAHPLDGEGARGQHLYGYTGHQQEYRPSPRFNHHFKGYDSDNYGYGPYDSHPMHRGYDAYPRHPRHYGYDYQPEYHHREQEYPREDRYADHGGYKVHSHHDYLNPHRGYEYSPYSHYDYPYHPRPEEPSPSAEAKDMMKAVDEEIHASKPQDKVLYEIKPIEKEYKEEPEVEEVAAIKAEELRREEPDVEEPEVEEPEVEEVYEDVDEIEEVETPAEPEPAYAEESSLEELTDDEEDEPEAQEDMTAATYPTSDDYSGYTYGYAGTAPINLESTFCIGQPDGNFANPGLTKKADPRCTYVTCAGNRTILFNCAPGTFNGRFLEYHRALWTYPSCDYQNAPHVRFESFGQDFCGQLDVGSVTDSPICTTSKRLSAAVPEQAAPEDTFDDVARDVAAEKSEEVADVYSTDANTASTEDEVKEQTEQYTAPEGRDIQGAQSSENQDNEVPAPIVDITMEEPEVPVVDTSVEELELHVAPVVDAPVALPVVPEEVSEDVQVPVEPTVSEAVPVEEAQIDAPEVDVTPASPSEGYVTPGYAPEVDASQEEQGPVDVQPVDVTLSKPEGKSLVQGSLTSDDYTGYKAGYGGAPEVLDNDFCANMEDGNYANPGLTPNVDPRCTYITCSGEQTFVFSCPLGTFNGVSYKHHYPVFGPEVSSYAAAHHYKYGATGFCGEGDYKGVCTR